MDTSSLSSQLGLSTAPPAQILDAVDNSTGPHLNLFAVLFVSTGCHSRDECSQVFPVFFFVVVVLFCFVFCYSSASMYSIIVNANQRVKNGVGLGTIKARNGIRLQVVDNLLKYDHTTIW